MVEIKQKPAAPELDWSGVDAVIEHEAHPQLAKRIEAFAGDAYGALVAPGINMIYARIEGETEATPVMVDALANIAGLRANTPIKIYWDRELNNYVWDGKTSIGSYNQATGGATPDTLPQMATYIVQTANTQLPNAQDLDSLSNGMLNKTTGGAVSSLAPSTSGNIAQSNGTAWTSTAPSFNASVITAGTLPVARGGTGAATLTSNNLLVGNGTSAVAFIAPSTAGRMLRSNGTVWNPYLNNIAATAAPTTGDDSADGYAVGSYWLDLTNDRIYIAIDVSVGAAIWKPIDLTGTVTSVALTVPSFLSVSGSPVTTSGTLAVSLATQTANTVFAGAMSGGAATPTFRALVNNDLPTVDVTHGGSGADLSATGGANQFVKQSSAGAAFTVGTIGITDTPHAVYRHHSNSTESAVTGTAEASLDTIPAFDANFFTVNKNIVYEAWGFLTTDAVQTMSFRLRFGGTLLVALGGIAPTIGSFFWRVTFVVGCKATGASGTVWSHGSYQFGGTAASGISGNLAVDTIDTTASITPDFTADWGAAGTTRTCTRTNSILTVYNP